MNERELPSTELSLKFMAWDVKKCKESIDEIVSQLKALNQTISKIVSSRPSSPNPQSKVQPINEIPF
jgi:DNA-directed RNA polymerase subunit F